MKLTNALLRRAAAASWKHAQLQAEITEAMTARYGCTHSDVDCDSLIDVLDYGGGEAPTVAECDEYMALCGVEPLSPS